MTYLTQGLHRALQQDPNGIATIAGDRRRTFAEQADRVSRLASALRDLAGEEEGCVAYLGLNSDRFTEYYLAAFWAGLIVNPVNTRWSAAEIAYSLADSEARILLADETVLQHLERLRIGADAARPIVWTGDGPAPAGMLAYEELIARNAPMADIRRGGNALAGLFYTGGTTGFPKGVMLSHANLVIGALGAANLRFVAPGAVYLHAAPMFHLADFAGWTIVALTGGTHVTIPSFTPAGVLQAIADHAVTQVTLVPAMLQLLVDFPERDRFPTGSLRQISYGGSPITQALLERAQAAFPGVGFCQAYGQTELSPITTLLLPVDHVGPDAARLLRSAGRAPPHAEIRVVGDDGAPLPPGDVGEIVARGGHVMQGYWRKPDETAAALKDGWMHTGDAGYLDERGYLFVVDRVKDMIITGGENVYSAEVENALARHPAVAACAVIGIPDARWGESVHAVVVLRPGAACTGTELRNHAKTLIAGYKCPRSVAFADALPIAATGKVLKRDLRAAWRPEQPVEA